MANNRVPNFRFSPGLILLYGLALGLLLAALQLARYRFWVLDEAEEVYIGLIAVFFTIVGIWAGRRGRPNVGHQHSPAPAEPLNGSDLAKVLDRLGITPREYDVLLLIAQGLSNQEIAARLFVSLNTVKTHTSNLFAKLDARRRTQAVQKAQALGLID